MPVNSILIAGGGAAGWLTAAYLARTLGGPGGVSISLVESPDIGILGVGEGTFPSIRGALSAIGIDEACFMRRSSASFKQGVKFVNWVRPRGAPGVDHYFHPFNQPSKRPDGPDLLPHWLIGAAGEGVGFAEATTLQKRVVDACRAPKRPGDRDYQGPMNYAYHFDAAEFAGVLAEEAQAMGVRRHAATIQRVEVNEAGDIAGLVTEAAGTLTADLYIDCTGFRAALIGRALGVPFQSAAHQLFNDRAVAVQIPYPSPTTPIASCTISTAQEAGWIWDIGLHQRRGVGYVYSSRHTDLERAEQVLRAYLGPASEGLPVRQLRFNVGCRQFQWVGNCVAVGLAAGFVEPLESSGIGLVESAAYLIAHLFPADGQMRATAALFNQMMTERFARVIDFIKMHYVLTQRRDTEFWRDNANPGTMSDTLAGKLEMWRCRAPHRLDFVTDYELYLPASWQFVLYGMEFQTSLPASAQLSDRPAAVQEFANLREVSARALRDLPDHRAMLDHLYRRADDAALARAG
ncbi:MAG: tryptophan halogenase family protein [Rhodospirillales bacterium]